MDSCAVAQFSSTIEMCASIGGRGTMRGKPFLKEVERMRLVTADGNAPCATFTVSDKNIACLTIQTNKSSKTFGGVGGLGSSSSMIHGVNDSTIIIESSTINEFSFVIQICNGSRHG